MQTILAQKRMDIKKYLALPLSIEDQNKISCLLCKSILIEPVICKGSCESVFCRKCAIIWKQKQGTCPKQCTTDFGFKPITSPEVGFKCPYSIDCMIKTPQQMIVHFDRCQFLSEQMNRLLKLKQMNLCQKGHRLLLKVDYQKYYLTKCNLCQKDSYCRQICTTCNQRYCIECRPILCSKSQPPIDKQCIRHTSPLEIKNVICDRCGTKPEFAGYGIRKDRQCQVNICDYCYYFLPESLEELPPYTSNFQCLNYHPLELLPKTIKNKCGYCYNHRQCQKYCPRCKQYYCLVCKKVQITQEKCQREHTFSMQTIKSRNLSKIICNMCYQIVSPTKYFMFDQRCNILVCKPCFRSQKLREYNKFSIRGRQRCQQIGHNLCLNKTKMDIIDQCHYCQRYVKGKYICEQCPINKQRRKLICFKCRKPQNFTKCISGHSLDSYPQNSGKVCLVCQNISSKGKFCSECQYSICQNCSKQ